MADKSWKPEVEEEEDDIEIEDIQYKHAKDALLFTIDVTKSMLRTPPVQDGQKGTSESPLLAALKCAYELLTQRIISSPNDMMGILLHGVDVSRLEKKFRSDSREADSLQGCFLLLNLGIPDAEDIKNLKRLIADPVELKDVIVPSSEPVSIANTIFSASQLFSTRAANFASRRLFIITDNDTPQGGDERVKVQATQRAKDLYDLGATIELFPLVQPGEKFDRSNFYDDIIYTAEPSDPNAPASLSQGAPKDLEIDGIDLLQSLLTSVRSRITPKRALFSSCPLHLGPGLSISVKGYLIFKRQEPRRTQYVYMGHEPMIAKSESLKVSGDTHQVVERTKEDIEEERKAYKFGGDMILFTKKEMAEIKNFGDPGITIIGFKNMDDATLPIWANVKTSTYIYPSEEEWIGSSRVFSALWQKMEKDKKFALVWFIPRRNATPSIAAMIPGKEIEDNGVTLLPAGLWICPLPYVDDLRQNPESVYAPAPDDLIDKMRTIVQQLQLPNRQYIPSKYPNPSLQHHYRVLQSMALGDDHPIADDKIIPKHKQIGKRISGYVQDWRNELNIQWEAWQQDNRPVTIAQKRPAPGTNSREAIGQSGSRKKSKLVPSDDVDEDNIRTHWERNTLSKLTVPELKAFLSVKGQLTSGKKAELVERAEGYFEQK